MIRYIAVSEHSDDLYAFAKGGTEAEVLSDLLTQTREWMDHELAPNTLDRTYRGSLPGDDLAVYSVPEEVEVPGDVDASMTHSDGIFGDHRNYHFVGYLIRERDDEGENEDEDEAAL